MRCQARISFPLRKIALAIETDIPTILPFLRIRKTRVLFCDGSPSSQVHGPGAVQFVGLDFPEKRAATIGDRNLLTDAMISLNEAGT